MIDEMVHDLGCAQPAVSGARRSNAGEDEPGAFRILFTGTASR